MQNSINLPFEELLAIIKNLYTKEKPKTAQLLMSETEISEEQWSETVKRKNNFKNGKISTESWDHLKSRILN